MRRILETFIHITIRTAFLFPVLWAGWNWGVTHFFTALTQVKPVDALVVVAAYQILAVYTLRPMVKEYIPVYIPVDVFTPLANAQDEQQEAK